MWVARAMFTVMLIMIELFLQDSSTVQLYTESTVVFASQGSRDDFLPSPFVMYMYSQIHL